MVGGVEGGGEGTQACGARHACARLKHAVHARSHLARACRAAVGRARVCAGWRGGRTQLHAVGFIKVNDIKSLNTNASRAWLLGLLFGLVLDLHKLRLNSAAQHTAPQDKVKALKQERTTLLLDLVRDTLDVFIPGTALEYFKLETGTVGLVGTASSLIGIYQTWPK